MPRGEYEPRSGELSPQEKVKQALQALERGVDSILTSESFASYLQTMSRFHQYSFGNVALIHMQNPTATRVAGYRKWQELGRQVKYGERGIKILVPHKARLKSEDLISTASREKQQRSAASSRFSEILGPLTRPNMCLSAQHR